MAGPGEQKTKSRMKLRTSYYFQSSEAECVTSGPDAWGFCSNLLHWDHGNVRSATTSLERKGWTRDHYAAISENCVKYCLYYCLYKATCSPRHVESCYYFIFLMKIGTETYFKSNLSQPSSRWTLQLTRRSNHKFQPNITFVCEVSARRLITMSSCM